IQYAGATYATPGWAWSSAPSEADLANWASAQDRSKTQRTDYAYDWRGQLSRSTSYDSVDSAGNGLGATSTQYVYDAAGQLIKTIDARSGATQSTYDGLGRVLTVTNALNQVSVNSYDDVGGAVRTTAFNGLITTSTFDKLGRAVSVVESGNTPVARYVTSANITLDGSSVSKTSGDGGWNAGVYSKQGIAGGAIVTFKPAQTDKYLMVGLNTDASTDSDYWGIDWAIYCDAGSIRIIESGTLIGEFGSYSSGDTLSVSYDGATIRYVRNGSVLRSVAVAITQPLYADSTFHSVGGKVTDLRFEPYTFADGVLVGEAGVAVDGSTATKTGGAADSWSSAFRSRVGYTGGASVSFRPAQANKHLMVGLNSDPAADTSYASLDWALWACDNGHLYIYENGNMIADAGAYNAGDLLSVSYDGTAVQYTKNGVVLRSVTTTITQPLYADSSFHTAGAQITDLVFTGGATLSGVKSYYDADSRLRMTQDALGNRQWFVYDEADRLVATINALGQLTETVYNKAGQVTQTIAYASLVNL
ncbi:hypothetical protein DBR42_15025, partial [Pelomonas sp. HMWF004]